MNRLEQTKDLRITENGDKKRHAGGSSGEHLAASAAPGCSFPQMMQPLAATMPLLTVPGNHEVEYDGGQGVA